MLAEVYHGNLSKTDYRVYVQFICSRYNSTVQLYLFPIIQV